MAKPERSKEVNDDGLTQKEAMFAMEYLEDLNKTQAYMRAYPEASYETAMANSSKLFKRPRVAEAIQKEMDARAVRTLVTKDRVIADIEAVKNRCMQAKQVKDKKGDAVYVETPDGEMVPAYGFDASGALKALELLGKHLVLFTDKTQLDATMTHHTGVLVSAPVPSIDEWAAQAEKQQTDLKKDMTETANAGS